jgi:hypothetical protein
MLKRADLITQTSKQLDLFSDFLDDFSPHPITGDIARYKNEQSIKQSVKNLVLTSLGERFFQPSIGSLIYKALFEPNDSVMVNSLFFYIQNALQNNEPRVNLLNVFLLPSDDSSVSLNIVYSIINSQTPQNLNLLLRRVR